MMIHNLLEAACGRVPGKVAVRDRVRELSYRELDETSRSVAARLVRAGVHRGDRVVISLGNRVETVVALLGVSRAGGAFVIADAASPPAVLARLVADAMPAAAIVARDDRRLDGTKLTTMTAEELLQAEPAARTSPAAGISHDLACLIYTSGSSGIPKGVVSLHANVTFAVEAIAKRLGLCDTDVIGCLLPLTFDYGLYQVFLGLCAGATLVLGEGAEAGPGMLAFIVNHRPTVVPLVPSMAKLLVRLARRSAHEAPVRMFTSTGERLPVEVISQLERLFPDSVVYSMYGLTECKRVSILTPEELATRPDSVGRPLDDTECIIVDSLTHEELPVGEVGELVVRGPHVMAGYWRTPDLTALRFRTWGPAQERVLFTGDLCRRDAEGFLFFEGRPDSIVKLRGQRVSLKEIEAAATGIDGVEDAVVLREDGERPLTLVVVTALALGQVHAALAERLEPAKIPDCIEIVEALPLTSHGKIDRFRVRELLGTSA
jgi:amino acid adenylation domain-containing protein